MRPKHNTTGLRPWLVEKRTALNGWLFCPLLLLLFGCTTQHGYVFKGRLENLAGDGWREEGTRKVGGMKSQPSDDGGRLLSLWIEPDIQFVLRHPFPATGKWLKASSTSAELRAWLVHDYGPVDGPISPAPTTPRIDLTRATPLKGEMELRWRSELDFQLFADVRTEEKDSAILQGTFEVRQLHDFEPGLLMVAPAMLMGVGPASTRQSTGPRVAKAGNTRKSTTSLAGEIRRLMKSHRDYRRFSLTIINTGMGMEFSNQTTFLDRPGLQMKRFFMGNDDAHLAALESVCKSRGLRFRSLPIHDGGRMATVEVYGTTESVTETAKLILKRGFGADENALLEVTRLD